MKALNHFYKISNYGFYAALATCVSLLIMMFSYTYTLVFTSFLITALTFGFVFFSIEKINKNDTPTFDLLMYLAYQKCEIDLKNFNPLKIKPFGKVLFSVWVIVLSIITNIAYFIGHVMSAAQTEGNFSISIGMVAIVFITFVISALLSVCYASFSCRQYDSLIKQELDNFEEENPDFIVELENKVSQRMAQED